MSFLRPLSGFTFASLLLTSPAVAADDDLLGMISEKTDFVFHIPDTAKTKANWERSPLKTVVDNDEVRPFIEDKIEDLFSSLEEIEDEDKKEATKSLIEGLKKIHASTSGEILLAMSLPEASPELIRKISELDSNGTSAEKGEMMFKNIGFLILTEAGDQGEDFSKTARESMEAFVKIVADEDDEATQSIVEKEVDGVKTVVLHVDDEDIALDFATCGVVGETAFFTIGNYQTEDLIESIKKGHKKPMSESDFLIEKSHDFQVIGDLTDFMSLFKEGMRAGMNSGGNAEKLGLDLDAGWIASGLDGFGKVSVSFDMSKPDLVFLSKIEVPEEGLMSIIAPSGTVGKPSIHAHKGVSSHMEVSLDLASFYDDLLKTVKAFTPVGFESFEAQIDSMEESMGIKLRDDLIANFGSTFEYLEYPADNEEEALNRICGILPLKDQAKFESSIKTIVGGMGMEIEKEEFLEHTIHHIALGGDDAVSYSFHDGKLLLGVKSGGSVKEMLKQIENPKETLWQGNLLEDHPDVLQSDLSDRTISNFEDTIDALSPLIAIFMEDEGPDFSKIKIPYSYNVAIGRVKDGIYHGKGVLLAK